MAKGVEDTAFFRYHRLLSLNEVGGAPEGFGLEADAFHAAQSFRARHLPQSMIATATHDTKRGEDARMRLAALSHYPEKWRRWLEEWSAMHQDAPVSRLFLWMFYQTLLAHWPAAWLEAMQADRSGFADRLKAALIKSLREAKQETNWAAPDEAFEKRIEDFVGRALADEDWLISFLPAARFIAERGMIFSLAQCVLKLTLPGIPDLYQGTEYWDLSFLDPDNRLPVDYAPRLLSLEREEDWQTLRAHWSDGAIKQRALRDLLRHRRANPDLYAYGDYRPEPSASNRLSFSRNHNGKSLKVSVPITPENQVIEVRCDDEAVLAFKIKNEK
jgi:(1->4)-alpha-D-glucan 1-alpha-D-glucosylmutase